MNIKVALIYPRVSTEIHNLWTPLGIIYLATVLDEEGWDVKIFDPSFEENFENLKKQVLDYKPDVIGFSTITSFLDSIRELSAFFKKNSEALIVMGGPHPSTAPNFALSEKNVDIIVIGEGEKTFPELLEALRDGKPLEKVKGIGFKKGRRKIFTTPREPIENLDELPYPNRDLLPDLKNYMETKVLNLMASRGCPFSCKFCQPTSRKTFGLRLRHRSPENVIGEIEMLIEKYKIHEFFFADDTFLANHKWSRDFLSELIRRNLGIRFIINCRVDVINLELADLLKKAGCNYIAFGVESGSPKILKILGKGITIEQIRNAFAVCKKAGIKAHAYLMIGSPQETRETLAETERLIEEIQPDSVYFSITTPVFGTFLYDECKKDGSLNFKSWAHHDYLLYKENDLPIKLDELSYDDIIAFRDSIIKRRKLRMLWMNAKELLIDTVKNPSLSRLSGRWKMYRKMNKFFG